MRTIVVLPQRREGLGAHRVLRAGGRVIVFLSTRHSVGGAQMNAVMLAEQCLARGEQAELWFLTRTGQMPPTTAPLRVLHEGAPGGLAGWLALAVRFLILTLRTRPKAMFAFHPLSCVLGALGGLATRYAFVAVQNNPPESQTPTIRAWEKRIGATPLYAANIAVSEAVREAFESYPARYRRKLRVVHNATPPLSPCPNGKTASRRALGLPLKAVIVGAVGRLVEQKNPEFLVETVARLDGVHLLLAGEGPLTERVRELAHRCGLNERIHLIGNVDGPDLTRAYRALDIFLMPSRFEGFGRTLVEAFACGAPAIVHDIPPLREVGGDASLRLPLQPDLWAEAITSLLADPSRRRTMVRAGRARERRFSLEAMTDGYLAAIGR